MHVCKPSLSNEQFEFSVNYKYRTSNFSSLIRVNEHRYLENVPAIVPLLEKEYRNAAQRLSATQEEVTNLASDK